MLTCGAGRATEPLAEQDGKPWVYLSFLGTQVSQVWEHLPLGRGRGRIKEEEVGLL